MYGRNIEIEAKASLVDRALRNLKRGDAFSVLDSYGDIGTAGDTAEGLFYRDTRFLSRFELRIEGERPLLLSSVARRSCTNTACEKKSVR